MYVKIKKSFEETSGFILDHAILAIVVKGDPYNENNHAVLGTFCYDDGKPIIVDSNRPYNPFYIDWTKTENNQKILKYFENIYDYPEGSELEVQVDYICYLNEQKLKESKEFNEKSENQSVLAICTNYKKSN